MRQQPRAQPLMVEQLDRLIAARHAQLGGYEHDDREHVLEAKRLASEGKREAARIEVRMALESRAIHAREKAKYANLVALRRTLQEARRNLTLAELMRDCSAEMRSTLERMPDVRALRGEWEQHGQRVHEQREALLGTGTAESDPVNVEEEMIRIEEADVLAELERLVTPTHVPVEIKTPSVGTAAAVAVTSNGKCIVPQ